MNKVFKAGAVWLAIACMVWLITIWRWQSTGYDATTGDIVGRLFVLPVVLAATLLLALWGVSQLKVQADKLAPQPASGSGSPTAQGDQLNASSDAALRSMTAWVLAEAVTLATGPDAVSAWDGFQSHGVRPSLDDQFQDMDGQPIFTSRVPGLDMSEWLISHPELAAGHEPTLPESVLRSLALLDGPLQSMLEAVAQWVPEGGVTQMGDMAAPQVWNTRMKSHLSGVAAPVSMASKQANEAGLPQLTVRLLLPVSWLDAERAAAIDWVRSQCGSLLDWVEATQAKGLRWVTTAVDHPEALWDEIDLRMVQWSAQARPELLLILAVDSALDESQVDRMKAVGELFTAMHQTGKVPGEGAVGLLLANRPWPDVQSNGLEAMRMWRPARARRDKSADAAGRVSTKALTSATTHAVSLSLADQLDVLVVSDADHRASRTGELFESLQSVLPGIDPMLAVIRVGECCGELGMARALVPVALACTALRAGDISGRVALAASVQSAHDRVVVAIAT